MENDSFSDAKTIVKLKIYTNDLVFGSTPESMVFSHVWCRVVKQYLTQSIQIQHQFQFQLILHYDSIDFTWSDFTHWENPILSSLLGITEMKRKDTRSMFNKIKETLVDQWSS